MAELPTGTVTLLFTDIEGSTKLLQELGDRYADVLAEHRRVLRETFQSHGGVEVDTQGDAFFYAFSEANAAVEAAREAQHALVDRPVRVRIGVHTGEPIATEEGYVGIDVHTAARIMGAGHGGQVLLSGTTRRALNASNNLSLSDLGEHRLKDLEGPVWIYQLGAEAFPPLKTIANTNLPSPASSFVGRARELEAVLALLREPRVRLLTLTGPGGSGKTRLAIEAAAELVGEYPSGVFWVGLAALRDPALVIETIAQTLGAKDGLAAHIGERHLLLLVDNLEQVSDAAPELSTLLQDCANLVVLVTSRELLRVQGEVEYDVPPLAAPEAVELFCERARMEPSTEVEELCARLDNLPLAVELAAARVKLLSPGQILARLSRQLDLLKGGRDADPRQQTLRATIEWSHDLLNEAEQRLFGRLAVFAGGCTVEAAEQVADADLEVLQSLVDKSLLRKSHERFSMLETIREYGLERLKELGEADALYERLARHVVAVARAEGAPNFLERQIDALSRLELEHENVRAAVRWALQKQRSDLVLALASVLWLVWTDHGHAAEALGWVDSALAGGAEVPDDVRLPALLGAGEVARFAGDLTRATELKEQLLDLIHGYEASEPYWEPGALADLADIALEQGDLARAREYAERSLAIRRARGVPPARALGSLGEIALRQGDLDRAAELLQESACGWSELGHDSNYAGDVERLGEVARRRGDLDRASELFAEALRRFVDLGAQAGAGECLQGLALVASARGQTERAGRLWGAGEALCAAGGGTSRGHQVMPELRGEAKAAGAAMSLDDAIDYALSGID